MITHSEFDPPPPASLHLATNDQRPLYLCWLEADGGPILYHHPKGENGRRPEAWE